MPDTFAEVENPTWLKDIRHFFEHIDIEHMSQLGINLATYGSVKQPELATSIYFQTKPPNAPMPPAPDRKWSKIVPVSQNKNTMYGALFLHNHLSSRATANKARNAWCESFPARISCRPNGP